MKANFYFTIFSIDIKAFYFTLKKMPGLFIFHGAIPVYFLFTSNNKYKCWAFLFIFRRLIWSQIIDILYSIILMPVIFKMQFKLPVNKSIKSIRIYNKNAHLIFCQVFTLLFVLLSMYLLLLRFNLF